MKKNIVFENKTPKNPDINPSKMQTTTTEGLMLTAGIEMLNAGFAPRKYLAILADVTVATSVGKSIDGVNLWINSSSTKSVPAIGALKVAPIAAPAPDAINLSRLFPLSLKSLPTKEPAPAPN